MPKIRFFGIKKKKKENTHILGEIWYQKWIVTHFHFGYEYFYLSYSDQ